MLKITIFYLSLLHFTVPLAVAGPVFPAKDIKDIQGSGFPLKENAVDQVEDCDPLRKDLYHQILNFSELTIEDKTGKKVKTDRMFKTCEEFEREYPDAAKFCKSMGSLACDGKYSGNATWALPKGGKRPVLIGVSHSVVDPDTHQYKGSCTFYPWALKGEGFEVGPLLAGSLDVWRRQGVDKDGIPQFMVHDWFVATIDPSLNPAINPALLAQVPAVPLILSDIEGKDSAVEVIRKGKFLTAMFAVDPFKREVMVADNCSQFHPGMLINGGRSYLEVNHDCNVINNYSGGMIAAFTNNGNPVGAVCIQSSHHNADKYLGEKKVSFDKDKRFNRCVPFAGDFRQAIEEWAGVHTQVSQLPEK